MQSMNIKQKVEDLTKNYIVMSVCINVVILLALSMIGYPHYEQNTDLMMQGCLYGITGEGASSYVLFINVVLAKIIIILIEIIDDVAWYSVVQYIMIFIALNCISCIYLKRKDDKFRRTVLSIFLFFVGYECYIRPSYLKTSAILCVAGMVLLKVLLILGRINSKLIFAGGIAFLLNIFSSMFSWRAFKYTLVVMLVLTIICISVNTMKPKLILYFMIMTMEIVCVSYGLHKVDSVAYSKYEQYTQAYEDKSAVEKIVMFGYPQYTRDIGNEIEVSEKNYSLVSGGYYLCSDQYAMQIAGKIASLKQAIGLRSIVGFVRNVPMNILQNGLFYLAVIMLFFSFVSREENRFLLLCTIPLAIVLYYISYIYFAWDSAYTHFFIWVPIATEIMISNNQIKNICFKNMMVWLTVFAIVLYNKFSGVIVTNIEHSDMRECLHQNITEESEVCSVDLNSFLRKYSIFERYPEGLLKDKNIVLLDGFYSLYSMFEDYVYSEEWNDETNITWLDCDRDYKWYLLE